MKLAICFNGQLRTGVKAAKSIKNFFGPLMNIADVFVHTWDVNTTRMPLNLKGCEPPTTVVPDEDHEAFKEIYKPINYYVENQNDYWERAQKMHTTSGDLVHLWHSAYMSNQFKKTYETANKIKYDFVIRLRPDCIFPPDRRFDTDLVDLLKNPDKLHFHQLFGDAYHVSTSPIMDLACDFYLKGNFYGRHFWPMLEFEKYMKEHGVELSRILDNRATILRKEFDYLDPVHFYWQINAINAMIFENVNYAKSGLIYTYENLREPEWLYKLKGELQEIFGDEETPQNYFSFYKDLP